MPTSSGKPHAALAAGPSLAQGAVLLEHLISGRTLAPLLGRSRRSQEVLYHLAYTLYTQGKYADAMKMFAYLLTCDHLDRRYYSGFGACLQVQGRHSQALKYYGIASMLDLTDPEPVLHSAQCHLALGDAPSARHALEYGLTQARAHARHAGFIDRLQATLEFARGSHSNKPSAPALHPSAPPPSTGDE